ncbi:unnamed protein product [Spirodela intermedia]|uniref:Uncharacterized protein n=2 Tax=Spirodela intermedia TaxID=51605 RepID=A0A7I8KHX6_SPIIN|nr:unnamed protein product [Spirodela intermedia]CAA6660507.1 unnamed protein product [Spirodela intermedia]CAA7396856.1 unnamed protein product [Spirodela intermedia]
MARRLMLEGERSEPARKRSGWLPTKQARRGSCRGS